MVALRHGGAVEGLDEESRVVPGALGVEVLEPGGIGTAVDEVQVLGVRRGPLPPRHVHVHHRHDVLSPRRGVVGVVVAPVEAELLAGHDHVLQRAFVGVTAHRLGRLKGMEGPGGVVVRSGSRSRGGHVVQVPHHDDHLVREDGPGLRGDDVRRVVGGVVLILNGQTEAGEEVMAIGRRVRAPRGGGIARPVGGIGRKVPPNGPDARRVHSVDDLLDQGLDVAPAPSGDGPSGRGRPHGLPRERGDEGQKVGQVGPPDARFQPEEEVAVLDQDHGPRLLHPDPVGLLPEPDVEIVVLPGPVIQHFHGKPHRLQARQVAGATVEQERPVPLGDHGKPAVHQGLQVGAGGAQEPE